MIYTAFSLIDITQTNVNRNNNLQFNQQQNLNTLIQSIGLRSQPINTKVKVFMAQDVVDWLWKTVSRTTYCMEIRL